MLEKTNVVGGRFRLDLLLESSGTLATWRGWDLKEQGDVVLKLATGMARDHQLRLAYEAELLGRLNCPHIVPLLAAGREGENYFVAMPKVGHQNLRERLKQGVLPITEVMLLGVGLLRALEAVHAQGLFHRDVKPENILLDSPLTRAVLIDFGLASEVAPSGSLAYMAPERLGLLDRPSDARADLYETGLVLYEACVGRLPIVGEHGGDFLRAKITQRPPSLCGVRSDVPRALESVIFRLLEQDPMHRYQQAGAAAYDLELLSAGRTPEVGSIDVRRYLAEPALVGRGHELALLRAELQNSLRNRVRLVKLRGASGSGKSRLLDELARLAVAQGVRVLSGRARYRSAQLPFAQLDSVFRPIAAELRENPDLLEELRPWGEVLAVALESLAVLYPGERTYQDVQLQIALSACRVLTAMSGPTVLLLDDCQWSNETLFELVEECLGRELSLLIVVAHRDDETELPGALLALEQDLSLQLSRLSRSETRALLESMAGSLPEEVVSRIWETSQGDPFLATSTLYGFIETKALQSGDGGWSWSPNGSLVTTSRRGGVILAGRLASLSSETQTVLEAGALVGRQFDVSLVTTLCGLSAEQVMRALVEARSRSLVWYTGDGDSYLFAHDRLREAALEQVSTVDLPKRHGDIARYLQCNAPERVYEIAYHFDRAAEHVLALESALLAARRAHQVHAVQAAEEYYRIAEKGLSEASGAEQYEILTGLGQTLTAQGRYRQAEEYYTRARAHCANALDQVALEAHFTLLYSATDVDACKEAAWRGLRILGAERPKDFKRAILAELTRLALPVSGSSIENTPEARREADLLGRIGQGLGTVSTMEVDMNLALWSSLFSLRRMRTLPQSRYYGPILANIGVGLSFMGLPKWGLKFIKSAMTKAVQLGDPLGVGQVRSREVACLTAMGDFERCKELFPSLMSLLEPIGDAWEISAGRIYSGLALYYRGELKKAREVGMTVLRDARRNKDPLHIASATSLCALAGFGYRDTSVVVPPAKDPMVLAFFRFAEALAELYAGRPEKAVALLHPLLSIPSMGFHTAQFSAWFVTACRQTAEALPSEGAHLAQKFLRLGRSLLGRALSDGKRHSVSYPHALRESALLAAERGLATRALREFDRAVEIARRRHMTFELAWTLVERGRIGLAFGWSCAEQDIGRGRSLLARLEARLPGEKPQARPAPTLSVIDRFRKVLEAGRRIAGCLEEDDVRQALMDAALSLLRCEECRLFPPDKIPSEEVSRELVKETIAKETTVLRDEGLPEDFSDSLLLSGVRSVLCAPVLVHDQVESLLYVSHRFAGQIFGEEERRIGDYLAGLAGVAIENARNFRARQEALQALRSSEDRFAVMFESAGLGLALVDLEDRILEFNPLLEDMFGQGLGGKTFSELLFHEDRGAEQARFQALAGERGEAYAEEVRFPRADGGFSWGGLTASRVPETTLVVRSLSDISPNRLRQIANFQELERQLLSSELHDVISQPLAGLHMQIQLAEAFLSRGQSEKAQAAIRTTAEQAVDSLSQLSGLMYSLRDPMRDGLRLYEAITKLAAQAEPIKVEYSFKGPEPEGLAALFTYRIVGESLTNVRRHSGADRVIVELDAGDGVLVGAIQDNGRGVPSKPTGSGRGLGLKGMKMRAELLGGSLAVTRVNDSGGTLVKFRLPVS